MHTQWKGDGFRPELPVPTCSSVKSGRCRRETITLLVLCSRITRDKTLVQRKVSINGQTHKTTRNVTMHINATPEQMVHESRHPVIRMSFVVNTHKVQCKSRGTGANIEAHRHVPKCKSVSARSHRRPQNGAKFGAKYFKTRASNTVYGLRFLRFRFSEFLNVYKAQLEVAKYFGVF